MAIWYDPFVPRITPPSDIRTHQWRIGSTTVTLLPKQFEFLSAKEEFVSYISGVGAGKTRVLTYKAAILSMTPNNRGLIGRFALPDLEDTTQRDLLDFLREAQLLKTEPNAKNKKAIVHCVDLETSKPLGATSEITFQHLDDPDHLRSRHLGWFGIDEGSELRSAKAWNVLVGRLRLPERRGRYQAFVVGNPKGRNWIFDLFFNQELAESLTCAGTPGRHLPDCKLSEKECNKKIRMKRRGIHSRSYDNYYLPEDYIENMVSTFSEEQRRREVEGEFDVFEGQVFKEFNHDIHVIHAPESWINGRPPREWKRLLACDVGGSSPWAFLWVAVDPAGNLVFYDSISETTSDVDRLANWALPKMSDEDRKPYNFQAKVIDYENKIAAEDLRKRGIHFTNARKMNKSGDGGSVSRLASYLHPNPKHHFPDYHPLAGQHNSPRAFFVAAGVPALIRELPQQQWDRVETTDQFKDVMDRSIRHDQCDCALYITRELPHAAAIPPTPYRVGTFNLSKISELYHFDVRREQEKREREQRRRSPGRRIWMPGMD